MRSTTRRPPERRPRRTPIQEARPRPGARSTRRRLPPQAPAVAAATTARRAPQPQRSMLHTRAPAWRSPPEARDQPSTPRCPTLPQALPALERCMRAPRTWRLRSLRHSPPSGSRYLLRAGAERRAPRAPPPRPPTRRSRPGLLGRRCPPVHHAQAWALHREGAVQPDSQPRQPMASSRTQCVAARAVRCSASGRQAPPQGRVPAQERRRNPVLARVPAPGARRMRTPAPRPREARRW